MATALITGASSGIGETYARVLAERKLDLVLVARSRDKLQALARELRDRHLVRVEVIAKDLTQPEAVEEVVRAVREAGVAIDMLVNNAGFGDYGPFTENSRDKQLKMIQLNILALVDLTYHFLPAMQQRGSGQIINIASIAGFQPIPYLAIYSASKAFVLHFSEALWGENRETGVKILAVCPGPTRTKFFDVAGFNPFKNAQEASKQSLSPEVVVRQSLDALERGDCTVVPGEVSNQFVANISRFMPRGMLVRAIEQQFRPR